VATATAPQPTVGADVVQRRTLRTLCAGQVLGGIGVGSGIAVGGLIAEDVSGSSALAGVSQTATVLGAAVAALPLARLMAVRGRRPGLALGYAVACVGAVTVVLGDALGSFGVVLAGAAMLGCGSAAGLQSRYAATDLAPGPGRARALATVVWATTVGVVLGPNLAGPGGALAAAVGLPELSGPLLFSMAAFAAAAAVVWAALRPDPLLEARRRQPPGSPPADRRASLRRSLHAVQRSRPASLGLATVVLGHTVMVAVMVMTPVHLRHEGASLRVVGLVISGHVAGMYALSPLVGWLADRFGRVALAVVGQVVLVAATAVTGTAGESRHAVLGVGLFLLGLGWSCALVAGSTLLTESVAASVRPGVQGAADFLMGLAGAAGGALAGVVVGLAGYGMLSFFAALLVVPVSAAALLTGPSPRSAA
jgi:MFS family permease